MRLPGRAKLRFPKNQVRKQARAKVGDKGFCWRTLHKFHQTRAEQLMCEGPTGAQSSNEIGGCGRWSRQFPWRGLPWGQQFSEHLPAHGLRSELYSKTDYVRIREGSAILPPSDPFRSILVSCDGGGLIIKSCPAL